MNIKEILSKFTVEEQKKLAQVQNTEELSKFAKELGHPLAAGEAEAILAVFESVPEKEALDENGLKTAVGGKLVKRVKPWEGFEYIPDSPTRL